ncbi:MAG: hypothetical protein HOP99_07495, partial [Dermatophilaceae bacterium]|nr:hypothetical protein [Dermatophilaceae bacterium]
PRKAEATITSSPLPLSPLAAEAARAARAAASSGAADDDTLRLRRITVERSP